MFIYLICCVGICLRFRLRMTVYPFPMHASFQWHFLFRIPAESRPWCRAPASLSKSLIAGPSAVGAPFRTHTRSCNGGRPRPPRRPRDSAPSRSRCTRFPDRAPAPDSTNAATPEAIYQKWPVACPGRARRRSRPRAAAAVCGAAGRPAPARCCGRRAARRCRRRWRCELV